MTGRISGVTMSTFGTCVPLDASELPSASTPGRYPSPLQRMVAYAYLLMPGRKAWGVPLRPARPPSGASGGLFARRPRMSYRPAHAVLPAVLALAAIVSLAAADTSPPPSAAALAAPPPASSLPGEGFTQIADKGGVKVYRREMRPGIELAAEGNIAATPERVRRVLLDYPNHARWQKHLKDNRILARGDGYLEVYQRLDLPVLDDRDFTLRVTWGDDGPIPWMRFTTANERGPAPVRGVVRVSRHEGGWRLEPVDGGKSTHAVYRFYLDLAGSFPAWMGKGQAASDLPELFANITKQLPAYP